MGNFVVKNSILIQAWGIYENNNKYYIEYTHAIYLRTIIEHYKNIDLVSPVTLTNDFKKLNNYVLLDDISKNISVHKLPALKSYFSAYKNFIKYIKLYYSLRKIEFDTVYTRFPSPFGWLQMFFFENRVVHFVGDPIDTVLKNNKIGFFRSTLKVLFFLPEYIMFILTCYGNVKVFTNGFHISKKLKKFGITAKPLISTTLICSDFYCKEILKNPKNIKLLYAGYLRKAKGVDVVINAFKLLADEFPSTFSLCIVGQGEDELFLKNLVDSLHIEVSFLGHIDDRDALNNIMRESDIFCFASLSEGSPRVILEAIANGLSVITTPVGSLPYVFKDKQDLLFFNFNDPKDLARKVTSLAFNYEVRKELNESAYKKVQGFKIESFVKEVFDA